MRAAGCSIRRRRRDRRCSPIDPELARGAYDVGVEALPDVPASEDWLPPPFEQFVAAHLRGLAIFVAVAGDEVVGYAKLARDRTVAPRTTA